MARGIELPGRVQVSPGTRPPALRTLHRCPRLRDAPGETSREPAHRDYQASRIVQPELTPARLAVHRLIRPQLEAQGAQHAHAAPDGRLSLLRRGLRPAKRHASRL